MEEGTFFEPTVVGLLKERYIEARLHADGKRQDEVIKRRDQMVRSVALPVYLIVDPKTDTILRRLDGAKEEEFVALLRGEPVAQNGGAAPKR